MKESEIRLLVLLKISPWIIGVLIFLIIIIKEYTDNTDPMDNSINKSIEYVEMVNVSDKNNNGFRVTYVTKLPVTKERLAEIQSRPHIIRAFYQLQKDAMNHFNNDMLHTDIYDFSQFARKYDCDQNISMHCIFVMGEEKKELYIGTNPKIPNSAKWMDSNTEQGNLWINHDDIYYYRPGDSRFYRYWKCQYPFSFSYTDEHFSHFSEDERIR